jgi:general secretion pathway protein D
MVAMPEPRPQIALWGEAVSLDFEETPLIEVVHAVLGDILELDYVVEHPISGQVTLRTRSPIPRLQLLPIIESLLRSNGAFMIRDPNDRIFVSASPEMSKVLPEFSNPDNSGAGYSNVIVPLQYIGAGEMAEILRPVAQSAGAGWHAHAGRWLAADYQHLRYRSAPGDVCGCLPPGVQLG